MDLRLTFNEVPAAYDHLRPKYTEALFMDVIKYSALDAKKKALEIGIGTGQATLPFLHTGCELTAVEIGDQLAQYTREKFSEYDRFKVITQDFESVPLEEGIYDLVYSASAFHWIAPDVGLPKVYQLLKPGGVFAWISVQPAPSQKHIHREIQKVYAEYRHYFGGTKLRFNRQREAQRKLSNRRRALKKYGFVEITDHLYHGKRTLNASDYVTLCTTYSDHRAMQEDDRVQMLQKIENIVNRYGGEFTFADAYLLCMGRKAR